MSTPFSVYSDAMLTHSSASVSGLVSSILSGASSAASQATNSPGAAPKMTGLPVAGVVGLAAWLLV